MEFQAILDAARALPVDDRVRLVDLIQDELQTQEADPDLMQELDKRVAEHKAYPESGITWETILAEARARHKK